MSRVGVTIMAHPARLDHAHYTARRLGHPGRVAIVVDDPPTGQSWPNAKRAWAKRAPDVTHHAVIQDDLLVCADFVETLDHLVTLAPGEVLSPYCSRKSARKAALTGKAWVSIEAPWGQAILMPVPLVEEFLAWEAANVEPEYPHDDRRVAFWLAATGRRSLAMIPSLVEHLGHDKSLLGHRGVHPRIATWFVGEGAYARQRNWTRGLSNPVRDPTGPMRLPDKHRRKATP